MSAQRSIDMARRQLHVVGQRSYRVFLVWTQRDRRGSYKEVKRIELMPVLVDGISDLSWVMDESGMRADGVVTLYEISLAQVSEHDLLGRLSKEDPADGVEFFYEIVRYARCGDDSPVPMRFTPAGVPEYDLANLQWIVSVVDAHNPKSESGEDQTVSPLKRVGRKPSIRM